MPRDQTHPFTLSPIAHPALPVDGLWLCRCPGTRDGDMVHSGSVVTADAAPAHANAADRLASDLDQVAARGICSLVSLIDAQERGKIGVPDLPQRARDAGLAWREWPIVDFSVPDAGRSAEFEALLDDLSQILDDGQSLAIHCRAGLGRSGLVAASLLARRGVTPASSIETIRLCRPGAIETAPQEAFITSRG
jgi:protein-tyrosine phosphatase